MVIIISKNGRNAKKIDKSSFEDEAYLQKYIHDNPESIPLKEDIKLSIVAKEFQTVSGSIDAIGVDKEGEIYLIETKLYKNPDKRLVVSQVLDYGAALWRSYSNNYDEFITVLDKQVNEKFGISLNQRLKDSFELDEEEVSILLDNIRSNLKNANFKFVVLMDKLHSQLKDLIIFINQNSNFSIFAAELEYYKYDDYEIMIPKLFGTEAKKPSSASVGLRKKWDEESFFEDAKNRLTEEQYEAVELLYNFSKEKADRIKWGTGVERGSFNPIYSKISGRSLYSVYSDGTLTLNFGWLHDNAHAEKYRDTFKDKLSNIKEITIPNNYQERYIAVPIAKWHSVVNDFISIVQQLINQ